MTICSARQPSSSPRPGSGQHPLVGIATPLEHASWRVWRGPAYLLGTGYSNHVRRAGGVPLLLPMGGAAEEAPHVVARLDGVLIPGGFDVDPSRYGQEPHPSAGPFDTARDEWESELIKAALNLHVPVFGICRGMQLLNVVLGGSLIQHLPDVVGTHWHSSTPGVFSTHQVRTSERSRLRNAVGAVLEVPTYHHQGINGVAPGLEPAAWAEDGTIEALEDPDGAVLAVQWHPEVAETNEVFEHFMERCRKRTDGLSTLKPGGGAWSAPLRKECG